MDCRIQLLDAPLLQDYKKIRLEALEQAPTAFSGSVSEEGAQGDHFHAMRLQVGPVYGAYADDKICGMLGVILFREEKLQYKAAIWGVYVSPEQRGKGIARQLMAHALAHLPPYIKRVTLGVEEHNEAAKKLYEAFGFEEYGYARHAFMHDGHYYNEYMMVKFL